MTPPGEAQSAVATRSSAGNRDVEYLSPPAQVSMTDGYFELASLDHFWVRRRFEVFQKLSANLTSAAQSIADVGCGHGIVQRQVELAYGREVTGFDLNENGLKHSLSQFSRVCCYDIFQKRNEFQERFDLIFLWDVLEHIADEDSFLKALLFHLARGGTLAISVPAPEWGYTNYDLAAGHVRRYSKRAFLDVARRNNLEVLRWTCWGFPLLPALIFRKLWLAGKSPDGKSYATGFGVRSRALNSLLHAASQLEFIPQTFAGTSLMALLRKRT